MEPLKARIVSYDVCMSAIFEMVDPRTRSVTTKLKYDPKDPHMVTVVFCPSYHREVPVVFKRQLLVKGLREPIGIGNIRIWPQQQKGEVPTVWFRLTMPKSEKGQNNVFEFRASRRDIQSFIDLTIRLVPLGSESSHLNVDAGAIKGLRPKST